jgi:hypothetical protein
MPFIFGSISNYGGHFHFLSGHYYAEAGRTLLCRSRSILQEEISVSSYLTYFPAVDLSGCIIVTAFSAEVMQPVILV